MNFKSTKQVALYFYISITLYILFTLPNVAYMFSKGVQGLNYSVFASILLALASNTLAWLWCNNIFKDTKTSNHDS